MFEFRILYIKGYQPDISSWADQHSKATFNIQRARISRHLLYSDDHFLFNIASQFEDPFLPWHGFKDLSRSFFFFLDLQGEFK